MQAEVVASVAVALEAIGIRYMVAESFASNLHGRPRMTHDADIVIDADTASVSDLVRLLDEDFYVSLDAALEAVRSQRQFNAIHFDTGFKVDLIVKKLRPFSDEEIRRRQPGTLANKLVAFATAEDTILTKLEWARMGDSERQYGDAMGIIEVQGTRLDWAYLEKWAAELGLGDLLKRARQGEPFR